ncbi:MAG: hypothetical protein ISF22_00155 [Methanomassiliicoccus sp.]|nr:hypothetical protein [Methanomassiliicoccus sp.]
MTRSDPLVMEARVPPAGPAFPDLTCPSPSADVGNVLCLVTPSCRRAWDRGTFRPVLAGNAYTGPFSRKCQTYAETFHHGSWCVLDPHHGFLFPDEIIRKGHDACLFRPWTEPITLDGLRTQVKKRKLDRYERLVVMGGRRFIFLVEEAFPGRKVRAPLAGLGGIGEMMHEINMALASGNRL